MVDYAEVNTSSPYISGRSPMLPFALEETLFKFQHHKPHKEELGQAPPTRAKTEPQQNYTHQIPII